MIYRINISDALDLKYIYFYLRTKRSWPFGPPRCMKIYFRVKARREENKKALAY